jgi:hypothetical protein
MSGTDVCGHPISHPIYCGTIGYGPGRSETERLTLGRWETLRECLERFGTNSYPMTNIDVLLQRLNVVDCHGGTYLMRDLMPVLFRATATRARPAATSFGSDHRRRGDDRAFERPPARSSDATNLRNALAQTQPLGTLPTQAFATAGTPSPSALPPRKNTSQTGLEHVLNHPGIRGDSIFSHQT